MDMIETKALEFAYPAEEGEKPVLALRGVDTAIEKGSFVVVLGHNGSGKSTFAKSLNAILLPCGGKVYVEGMDTQDEACLLEIRRRVGMVFQNPDNQIVANVVEEDVAFAPDRLHVSALAMDGGTYGILRPSGQHIHPADSGNGRQGFAPEAQRPDFGQILRCPELAGGVAQKGGGQLLRRNAAAVVRHPDQAHAAPLDLHHDGGGSGVDGVFHQLLYNGGGALHHLAGGDQVGYMRR